MNPIIITENACKAFLENLKSDNSENKYIRIYIQGGGCKGMIFSLDLTEEPDIDDELFESNGVKFVIDTYSKELMGETIIDYQNTLNESGFKFINNSKRSCGCGKSFAI